MRILLLLAVGCTKPDPAPLPAPPSALVVETPSATSSSSTSTIAAAPAPLPGCIVDSDCVITTFHGCCDCDAEPHAEPKRVADLEQAACRVTKCEHFPAGCAKVTAPGAFRAVCKTGACTARPK